MRKKYTYGVAGLYFDGKVWRLSFASNAGYRHTPDICFRDDSKNYIQLIETIQKNFSNQRLTCSRVFLLYSPPGSDNIFPVLYQKFQPVIVVYPERLMLHQKRLGRVYNNKAEMLVEAAITGLTTDLLLLETTNACTFRCLFCPQDQMKRKKERMSFENARRIVNDYAVNGVGSIAFHLMGEPTSTPYLPVLVKLAADLRIEHTLTTNASSLTADMAVALLKSGLKRTQLSVQTFGKEQFYAFKRPAPRYSYESVLANIKKFIQLKWEYAPGSEVEIHVMDNSLYQPRGVKVVSNDHEAHIVVKFWRDFLVNAAQEVGRDDIIDIINHNEDVRLARAGWVHLNYIFEPTISLKFKMAGHWTQEFLEEGEVIIMARKGVCQQIVNRGNNQLAVQSNGDVVLCCFDFDGGTKIGNIKDNMLKKLDQKAEKFRRQLAQATNKIPFKICSRCLGTRVRVFSPGKYKQSGNQEMSFSNISIYWANSKSSFYFNIFRQAGIGQLSVISAMRGLLVNDYPVYGFKEIPEDVEAIIFPADYQIDTVLMKNFEKQYPDKFIGQINLVALNPFARDWIISHKQKNTVQKQD